MDVDCWYAVINSYLDHDDISTLYSLLLVDKLRFMMAVPVLYKKPFSSPSLLDHNNTNNNNNNDTLSRFSTSRLEHLLGLSCGYYTKAKSLGIKSVIPSWKDALYGSTTVNYTSFVQELPNYAMHSDGETNSTTYLEFYAEKLIEISPHSQDFQWLIPFVDRLSKLSTISIRNGLKFEGHLLKDALLFIQLHRQRFPNGLQQVRFVSKTFEWDSWVQIQKALAGGPEKITLSSFQIGDFGNVPTESVREVDLSGIEEGVEYLERFLQRCTRLECLKMKGFWTNEFHHWTNPQGDPMVWRFLQSGDPKEFWYRRHHHHQQQIQEPSMITPQPPPQVPLVALPLAYFGRAPLARIHTEGHGYLFKSLCSAFQKTLREIVHQSNSRDEWMYSPLDFSGEFFPNLETVSVIDFPVKLTTLHQCSDHLRSLTLQTTRTQTLTSTSSSSSSSSSQTSRTNNNSGNKNKSNTWRLPPGLVHLHLSGGSTYALEIESLKECVDLQTLYLSGTHQSATTTVSFSAKGEEMMKTLYLVNLKSVHLSKFWANLFQGRLLARAPRLEILVLAFGKDGPLNVETFYEGTGGNGGNGGSGGSGGSGGICYPALKTLRIHACSIFVEEEGNDRFEQMFGPTPLSALATLPGLADNHGQGLGSGSISRKGGRGIRNNVDPKTSPATMTTTSTSSISLLSKPVHHHHHHQLLFPNLEELMLSRIGFYKDLPRLLESVLRMPRMVVCCFLESRVSELKLVEFPRRLKLMTEVDKKLYSVGVYKPLESKSTMFSAKIRQQSEKKSDGGKGGGGVLVDVQSRRQFRLV